MNKINGAFRKKQGFTITSNSAARDKKLSFKAKGLYLLIQSYITLPNFDLTKTFLMTQCEEGERAFDSAWNELKHKGYLKLHLYPDGKGQFRYEYELLDDADSAEGVYLYRYDKNGNVTSTNRNLKAMGCEAQTKSGQDETEVPVLEDQTDQADDARLRKQDNVHPLQNVGSGSGDVHPLQNVGSGSDNVHTLQNPGGGKRGRQIKTKYNNTENISNLSINHIYTETEKEFKEQIDYDRWMDAETEDHNELLNLIVKTATDLMTMPDEYTWRINQVQRSAAEIRDQLTKLKHEHIVYIMDCIKKSRTPIKNVVGFIRTSLYNAPDTYSLYKTKQDESKKKPAVDKDKKSAGRFHNFTQRSYDYGAMEIEFVRKLHENSRVVEKG